MMPLKKIPVILFSLLAIVKVSDHELYGQDSRAKATADTSRILIGDQVNIILEINQSKNQSFEFPVYRDTLIDKVEILSVSPVDTVVLDDRLKLRQHLVITSFDTGFYVIPSFIFHDRLNLDSLKSNALPLEVLTIEVDTTKGITDIKLPMDVPFGFRELAPFIVVGLILIAIAIMIWYYMRKRKKEETVPIVREKPVEPAHLWALRELDKLSSEKLWQKGKIKLFHSRLTDVIRTYLEFRFNIPSMEFTTSETIEAAKGVNEISEENRMNLQTMLELADLVKFAKWDPLPDENENSQQIAYDFVLKTKLVQSLRKEATDSSTEKVIGGKGKEGDNVE